ncbi:RDD family protein [Pikeienuella piscinae]|uniref:RDD family protein n=1 Tax=Pikeienuella piscinae TaxID=2748098 RepID=A0A7L5BSD9_9RHOB|nr:RDD family protein [Pikeienuella piscinae]QIE54000.1 RDD family protein [Pikeienuella piscinae]
MSDYTAGLAPGVLPDPVTDRQFYDGVPARRLLAFLIDVVLVWGIALIVGILTLGIGFFILGFVIAVVDFIYRVATISNRSATPGMRFAGIELRQRDGARFDLFHAIGHTLLFYVAISFIVVQLVSVALMAGSAMGRGLHDLPFGSTMINSPA